MNLEELKTLGLTEEQAKKILENFNKELKDNYVEKLKFDEVSASKSQLDNSLKERDKQLEELKKIDVNEFKTTIDNLQKENESQRKNHVIDMELLKAKAKNVKAVKALIDDTKVKIKEDGTIEGLDIEALKKSDSYLFDIEKVQTIGTGFTAGKPPTMQTAMNPQSMHYEQYEQTYNQQQTDPFN